MGCVNSRADINDLHANVFQVMNVDDLGNLITPGRLEITESDIVLYQRGKQPVKWPLRCLRRYGYDSEIFSFESGRRCSTGPGIYAFKCRRADQLFNLVQSNIQVCNSSGDDTVSRDLSISAHSAPSVTRASLPPVEANYLDPMPARTNSRATSRFAHSQQNGRLGSVGSSSGPISPQGTMGSPSPPPIYTAALPLGGPPTPLQQAPPPPSHPSALYVNEQVLSGIALELEFDNNNKSLRRSMQRSHTISSTSSTGLIPESSTGMMALNHQQDITKSHVRPPSLGAPGAAMYMNIDISSEPSPLSPTFVASPIAAALPRDQVREIDESRHAYMNVSTGLPDIGVETSGLGRIRPQALPQPLSQHHQPPPPLSLAQPSPGPEWDESSRHCYANLEPAEIESLRIRFSNAVATFGNSTGTDKSPPPIPPVPLTQATCCTPPPSADPIREVNYAVLDLDKSVVSTGLSTSTLTSISTSSEAPTSCNTLPSPPDSPNKPQKGYATIDFNKTAALSHSVNPNVVNDNEGSRKTRHNSTINDLTAPSRNSSSISE